MTKFVHIQGRINVSRDRVSIDFCWDLANYYTWLIKRGTYNTINLFTPRHGSHVSVIIPTKHEQYIKNKNLKKILDRFHGKKVDVWFNPEEIRIGGKSRNFTNFWVPVHCDEINRMKDLVGIREPEDYRGHHITFCSDKHEQNNKGNLK